MHASDVPIDFARMREQLGGDDELIGDVIALFLDEYPQRLREIRAARDAHDDQGVRRAAHTLKGSAGNLMAHGVVRAAAAIESLSDCGDATRLGASIDWLVTELDRAASALSDFRLGRLA